MRLDGYNPPIIANVSHVFPLFFPLLNIVILIFDSFLYPKSQIWSGPAYCGIMMPISAFDKRSGTTRKFLFSSRYVLG